MALSNSTVWEVRSSGNDSNGGGFKVDSPLSSPNAPTLTVLNTTGGYMPASSVVYVQIVYQDSLSALTVGGTTANLTNGSGTNTNRITVALPGSGVPSSGNWNIYVGSSSSGPFWAYTTGLNVTTTSSGVNNMPAINPSVGPNSLSAPSAPTATATTGGSMTNGTYYFVTALIDSGGQWTAVSSASSATISTPTSNAVSISAPTQGSATSWAVLGGTSSTGPFWIIRANNTTFGSPYLVTVNPPTSVLQQARGTDYSVQDSAQLSVTDGVCTSSSQKITSVTGGFTRQMVGNVMQISGANAGFYEIIAYESSNSVFVDRALSSNDTGVTIKVGGALGLYGLSQTQGTSGPVGHKAFIKYGTYTMPAVGNGAGGYLFNNPTSTVSNSASSQPFKLVGYYSTRGDLGTSGGTDYRPTIQLTSSAVGSPYIFRFASAGVYVENLILDCNSVASSTGLYFNAGTNHVENCKIINFGTQGITMAGTVSLVMKCEISGGLSGSTAGFINTSSSTVYGCNIHSNQCAAIVSAGCVVMNNLIYGNSGASSDGYRQTGNNQSVVIHNTIHNNGRYGINMTANSGNQGHLVKNNLITNNSSQGFAYGTTPGTPFGYYCDNNAFYNNNSSTSYASQILFINTQGVINVGLWSSNDKNLTASPYTDASTYDFTLNNSPNAGVLCRGTGVPNTVPGNTQTSNEDIGLYHISSSSGSGIVGVSIPRLVGGI